MSGPEEMAAAGPEINYFNAEGENNHLIRRQRDVSVIQ